MIRIITILLAITPSLIANPAHWVDLFNGSDLSGWHTMPGGKWEAKGGVILGTSQKAEKRHGLLVSDKEYSNFILRAKFKVTRGDSGLYFRVQKTNMKKQGVTDRTWNREKEMPDLKLKK